MQPTLQHKPTDGSASPHRRLVSQHNSSSSPKHIALGFGHRRSLTGSDRRSPIGHVARRLFRCPSLGLLCRPSLSLLRCSLNLNLNLKVFHNFSLLLFFLSNSLSLFLFIWKIKMKCDGIAENYFISSSSIGIVHTQGTKLNLEITQGDYETLLTC